MSPILASFWLTLQWCDPQGLYAHRWERVGREPYRAFEPLGIGVDFNEGGPGAIPVVLVPTEPAEWGLPAGAMGTVAGPPDRPRIYVFFSAVVRAVGYRPEILRERWLTQREERDLGRALARVIAHEVIHAVLPSRPHGEGDITRWKLDRESLLASRIEIDPILAEELRAVLSPSATPSSSRR